MVPMEESTVLREDKFEGAVGTASVDCLGTASQTCAFEIRAVSFGHYQGTLLCARGAMYGMMMECVQQACHSLDMKLRTA